MNALRPRVLVAEPDRPTRAGLKLVVESGGMVVAGEAADAAGAVSLTVAERPDLALVAAELPGGALQAIRRIATGALGTRVVVFTAAPSGDELLDALLAGAVGYLSRDTRPARLPVVLRGVLNGEAVLPRRLSRRLVDALRGRDARRALVAERAGASLTDREWEILDLLATGRTTGEIAHGLDISTVTARRHISSLVGKLGVADRAGAVELVRSCPSG